MTPRTRRLRWIGASIVLFAAVGVVVLIVQGRIIIPGYRSPRLVQAYLRSHILEAPSVEAMHLTYGPGGVTFEPGSPLRKIERPLTREERQRLASLLHVKKVQVFRGVPGNVYLQEVYLKFVGSTDRWISFAWPDHIHLPDPWNGHFGTISATVDPECLKELWRIFGKKSAEEEFADRDASLGKEK